MTTQPPGIRLDRLTIENYKKIDHLEIEFPRPRMPGDADVLMLGSKNGGGKTSVLECCALLILAGILPAFDLVIKYNDNSINSLIRAGCRTATINGNFFYLGQYTGIILTIDRETGIRVTRDSSALAPLSTIFTRQEVETFFPTLLAFSNEPLILPPLLHFNSYRKVEESNPELGIMASNIHDDKHLTGTPISAFKLEILSALMGQAALFEGVNRNSSEAVLFQLNTLTQRYCGGKIEHLRQLPDGKVDIRIKSPSSVDSFSFDGLSSGQKEIIATLFMIWRNTQSAPGIVLIDEPELHLNAEWHGDFIRQLHKLAPQNQYIMATHSEQMFRSVEEYQRMILLPDNEAGAAV